MAAALWTSGAPPEWARLRADAPTLISAHGKPGLAELEAWLWDELPAEVAAREKPCLTKADVGRVFDWYAAAGAAAGGGASASRRAACSSEATRSSSRARRPTVAKEPLPPSQAVPERPHAHPKQEAGAARQVPAAAQVCGRAAGESRAGALAAAAWSACRRKRSLQLLNAAAPVFAHAHPDCRHPRQ